jgi:hypothetical protein
MFKRQIVYGREYKKIKLSYFTGGTLVSYWFYARRIGNTGDAGNNDDETAVTQ